jgi:hypothetical protein
VLEKKLLWKIFGLQKEKEFMILHKKEVRELHK